MVTSLPALEMSEAPLISIVDDDALARDGIRELVESLGYNAVTFASAEHFLQSGVIAHTTCMIVDLQMPGLNGGTAAIKSPSQIDLPLT